MALVHFMGQQQGAQRTYALLTLANKLLSQCEAQVCVGWAGNRALGRCISLGCCMDLRIYVPWKLCSCT